MKMYILVKETIPVGFAVLASAHASLACYLKFRETEDVARWLTGSFKKVICKVDDIEFEKSKSYPDNVVLTESALEGQEVAIAFKPRSEWPKAFQYFECIAELGANRRLTPSAQSL